MQATFQVTHCTKMLLSLASAVSPQRRLGFVNHAIDLLSSHESAGMVQSDAVSRSRYDDLPIRSQRALRVGVVRAPKV